MSATSLTGAQIVERGQEIYEREIRARVETEHRGEFLEINVETGEYVMDRDAIRAAKLARARFPDAPLFTLRIGHPTAYRIGGGRRVNQP